MGSCSAKEQELNEDLERLRKERNAKERAERDRVANSKLILVKVTSPAPLNRAVLEGTCLALLLTCIV